MSDKTRKSGFEGLLRRLHSSSVSREDMQKAAQLAIEVEFTTIPAYLTALYSMAEQNCEAYQALRSVAMEEMFHVNQAANILVALGGEPRFTGSHAPKYPCYLPHANPDTTPLVGLCQATTGLFGNMFTGIETPAPAGAPPQGDNYDSIAQLYEALGAAVDSYPGNPFDQPSATCYQRTNIYLGKFGGTIVEVTDKESATKAITEIVQQGEGTVPATKPLVPVEKWGAYNHYGHRTDGTYGPILGTPVEMSHFTKFRKVSLDQAHFPPTLPVVSNGNIADYSNPMAADLAHLFNKCYSILLKSLEHSFRKPSKKHPDPYFGVVMNMMHLVLPNIATALMNTPANKGGDASTGPNASPTWEWTSGARLQDVRKELEKARKMASGKVVPPALAAAARGLDMLPADDVSALEL